MRTRSLGSSEAVNDAPASHPFTKIADRVRGSGDPRVPVRLKAVPGFP